MIHDPAIFYDEVSGNYYTYSTGAICQKSKDLVHWQEIGKVVERPPQESVEWTGSEDIWAPDIVKVGKEYRLYCSNSSWGVRQSCIFLAVADCPEGPFEPKGCVLKTTEKFPQSVTNAIDANIIEDAKTGEQYMLYGSFWGGCHVLKLNRTTGFAEEEGIGVCIARRPKWQSGSMEGPYMVYNADILWFSKGFVEYEIPNFIPGSQKITQILISAELSSEAPGINNVWPSDISFYLNDVCIGTWTSPGDFGDVRGIFTPDWWFPNWNQYGLLKMIVINKKGTFIDGLQISDVTIRDFNLDYRSSMKLRMAVNDNAEHVGGLTIFGKSFGNYGQDIKVSINYAPIEE